ncbi:MAG: UDP-glucose 4-epimerase [bacterium]|jgi:UDP-glucose 4-epimerase
MAKKTETPRPEILVTGAGGQLAHHVINSLKSKYKIIAVDFREQTSSSANLVHYRLDFSKRGFESIFKKHNIQGVIHLGRIQLSEDSNRFQRYNTNVLGTQKLLDLCVKYKVKQVQILSTYHVYGAHAYNPSLIDESFPLKASSFTKSLSDSVELENLAMIYLWKHPELNLTILRPCNIVGPGVNNSMAIQLRREKVPYLMGFSPLMQFLHVADAANAVVLSYEKNKPGVYNVAPDDYITYLKALELANCKTVGIPSIPPFLARKIFSALHFKSFPLPLLEFIRYAVVLDGSLFKKTFDFEVENSLSDIFSFYREQKEYGA